MKKKEPIYSFSSTVKDGDKEKVFAIQIKYPTRSQLNDADMFYSIRLSKYIKDGLLTSEQVQKRQMDVGGTFTEEQQKLYSKLQVLLAEKREMLLRLLTRPIEQLSEDEAERKKILSEDIAILIGQIQEFEFIRNSIFEHTANAKARNDVVLWWILNLAQSTPVVDGKEEEFKPMFSGEGFDGKKMALEQLQDEEDPLLLQIFDELSRTIALWYLMGVTDRAELAKYVKESGAKMDKEPAKEEKKDDAPATEPSA